MPRWLLKYFCIWWMGATTIFFFPYSVFLVLIGGGDHSMKFIQGLWSRLMLWAPGATLNVRGKENVDPSRPTVFISNHQSTLDIPALLLALSPVPFRFVIKKIIQYVPLFGWYLTLAGFIFIDRSSKKSTQETLERASQRIRGGTSILVFAEGTRSENGRILPFKKAMFAIPARAGVLITPVAVEGSRIIMPKNSWSVQPGEIRVNIGKPIDPAPFGDDREALAQHVREKVIELAKEIGGPGGDAAAVEQRPEPRASQEEAEA